MWGNPVTWQQHWVASSAILCFLYSVISLPSFFPLLVSEMGAWMPCMGADGWVVGMASHGNGIRSRSWLVGLQWKPLDITGTQPPLSDAVVNLCHAVKRAGSQLCISPHPGFTHYATFLFMIYFLSCFFRSLKKRLRRLAESSK